MLPRANASHSTQTFRPGSRTRGGLFGVPRERAAWARDPNFPPSRRDAPNAVGVARRESAKSVEPGPSVDVTHLIILMYPRFNTICPDPDDTACEIPRNVPGARFYAAYMYRRSTTLHMIATNSYTPRYRKQSCHCNDTRHWATAQCYQCRAPEAMYSNAPLQLQRYPRSAQDCPSLQYFVTIAPPLHLTKKSH